MSEFDIKVPGGESRRLLTAGKYCDRDILVTAEGGLPDGDMSDPEYVYAVTRPKDWLPMPWPGDDEVYMFGLIPEGMSGWVGAKITFTGSCVVEFGRLVDGAFVAQESLTPTSGTLFSKQLFASDYGDLTSDGQVQYMGRITAPKATQIDFTVSDKLPGPQGIVDIACGIPLTTGMTLGNYNAPKAGLLSLRYLRFLGNGTPGDISGGSFVGGCYNLLSVTNQGEMGNSPYGAYSLNAAKSLMAVSGNLFDYVTSVGSAFSDTSIFRLKLSCRPTNVSAAFRESTIQAFSGEDIDTSLTTNFFQFFYDCRVLEYIVGLDISSATNVADMFTYCFASRVTFAGDTTPGGWTITLPQTLLSHDALVEMIDSLPVATATATIVITNNPGASELTDDEIAVATAKNWTVTI